MKKTFIYIKNHKDSWQEIAQGSFNYTDLIYDSYAYIICISVC